MNDNDEDAAYVEAMTERGTLMTFDEVEASIRIVGAGIELGLNQGFAANHCADDQNAVVAEAAFRWLLPRLGSAANVGFMMRSIAKMHSDREPPQPPEAA